MLWGLAFSYLIFGEVPGLRRHCRRPDRHRRRHLHHLPRAAARTGTPPRADSGAAHGGLRTSRARGNCAGSAELRNPFSSLRVTKHVKFGGHPCPISILYPPALRGARPFSWCWRRPAHSRRGENSIVLVMQPRRAPPRRRPTSRWHLAASGRLYIRIAAIDRRRRSTIRTKGCSPSSGSRPASTASGRRSASISMRW